MDDTERRADCIKPVAKQERIVPNLSAPHAIVSASSPRFRHLPSTQRQDTHSSPFRLDPSSSHSIEILPCQATNTGTQNLSKRISYSDHKMIACNIDLTTPQSLKPDSRNAWNSYGHLYDRQREKIPMFQGVRDRNLARGYDVPVSESLELQSQYNGTMCSVPDTNNMLEGKANLTNEEEAQIQCHFFDAAVENPQGNNRTPISDIREDFRQAIPAYMGYQTTSDTHRRRLQPSNTSLGFIQSPYFHKARELIGSLRPVSASPDSESWQGGDVLAQKAVQSSEPSRASVDINEGLRGFWRSNKLF